MFLRSFVKINLLFRIMDPLKRKSPVLSPSINPVTLQLVDLHCNSVHAWFIFMRFVVCRSFLKNHLFSKYSFRNVIRMSHSLDFDQAWHFVLMYWAQNYNNASLKTMVNLNLRTYLNIAKMALQSYLLP